jgi:hypothetical protein
MSRLTLLQRLKPEVKAALEANEEKYSSSVESIFAKLDSENWYNELKVSDVTSIYTFADITLVTVSCWDFKYGDNLFIKQLTTSETQTTK